MWVTGGQEKSNEDGDARRGGSGGGEASNDDGGEDKGGGGGKGVTARKGELPGRVKQMMAGCR